jgi:NADH-quinone oxidoreductase subunit H
MDWINKLNEEQAFVLWSVVKIVGVVAVLLTMVAYGVLVERKVSAFIQNRMGPNRTTFPLIGSIPMLGPALARLGIWQPIADGLKSFLKEDFTPAHVRKIYFWLAPAITMIPAFLTVAVIPFGSEIHGEKLVIANLNVGILYTFGIVSLGVYGIVLAGYAANSKYPFLGGIRSSAQMISYEIAMGLCVIPVFLLVGDLNLGAVIHYQSGFLTGSWPLIPNWLVFKQPLAFAIFLVAAFAETNRLPFDMPECETELVGGYNTEYSSMKFAMFFMGEYANMITSSAMMVTLFFGGWTCPWLNLDTGENSVLVGVASIGVFLVKVVACMVVMIWVRWMWPRFRYDQLMNLGWRRFVPLALANIFVTALILWMTR